MIQHYTPWFQCQITDILLRVLIFCHFLFPHYQKAGWADFWTTARHDHVALLLSKETTCSNCCALGPCFYVSNIFCNMHFLELRYCYLWTQVVDSQACCMWFGSCVICRPEWADMSLNFLGMWLTCFLKNPMCMSNSSGQLHVDTVVSWYVRPSWQ